MTERPSSNVPALPSAGRHSAAEAAAGTGTRPDAVASPGGSEGREELRWPRWVMKDDALYVFADETPDWLIYENAKSFVRVSRGESFELAIGDATANRMMWPVPLEVEHARAEAD
jgi:hypothetical protein